MKYFFLSEGWTYSRVWEFGGLWDKLSWGRNPEIRRLDCGIVSHNEVLWLYAVEDAVLMVEVTPETKLDPDTQNSSPIGQVVLKRLIDADGAIEMLASAESIFNSSSNKSK